jgi:hypothetical protein
MNPLLEVVLSHDGVVQLHAVIPLLTHEYHHTRLHYNVM